MILWVLEMLEANMLVGGGESTHDDSNDDDDFFSQQEFPDTPSLSSTPQTRNSVSSSSWEHFGEIHEREESVILPPEQPELSIFVDEQPTEKTYHADQHFEASPPDTQINDTGGLSFQPSNDDIEAESDIVVESKPSVVDQIIEPLERNEAEIVKDDAYVVDITCDTSLDVSAEAEEEHHINDNNSNGHRKSRKGQGGSPGEKASILLRQSLKGSLIPRRLKRTKVEKANIEQPTRATFDNVESIEAFLRDEIEMNSEMTKTGFRKLLLDQGGIHAEDALIDTIFGQTDKDGNGLLDAHELATFIHEIKPSTKNQRRKYIILSCLTYPPFYLTFLCLNASLMSVTTNIREREYGDLYGKKHPYWAIASLSDLLGLCGYVILKWEEERLKYENLQQAKIRLVQWVNVELPRFVNKTTTRKLKESMKTDVAVNARSIGNLGMASEIEELAYNEPEVLDVHMSSTLSYLDDGNVEPDLERGEGTLSDIENADGLIPSTRRKRNTRTRNIRVSFADDVSISEEEENVENKSMKEEAQPKPLASYFDKGLRATGGFVTQMAEGGEQLVKGTGHQIMDGVTHIPGGEQFVKAAGEALKATGEQFTEALTNIGRLGHVEIDREEAITAIRAFLFEGKEEDAVDDFGNQGLDLQELRLLLETMGVFLADHALQEVFAGIDIDGSGSITIEELLLYATKEKGILSSSNRLAKYFAILTRCCKTIGWWTSWSYVFGAICWVLLSLVRGASYIELKVYLGVTCIFYLIGALGNLSNLYRSTEAQVWQIDNARMMLRGAGISVGLSQMEEEASKKGRDKDGGHERARHTTMEDEVVSIQGHIQDNALAKLEQNNDMDMRHSILAVRSTVKTMGSNISGTSSGANISNRNNWQVYDAETIAKAQKKGAVALFQTIDVSDDGNIDEQEFYDALVTLGVLIPSHSFSALYKAVDVNRDGKLQLTEFIDYVAKIEPGLSARRRRLTTLYFMFHQISLYLIGVQIFAGSAQTHAALVGLSAITATKNLFVAGSCGWCIGSLYFFAIWPRSKGGFFDQLENAKFMIKSAILDGCEIYHNAPSTKYLGNMRKLR